MPLRTRMFVMSLVAVVSLFAAAVASAASGTAGSLAIIAGVNRSILSGQSTATPVSARGVAADSSGNLYIADPLNNVIEKVDTAGNLTIVAGNGAVGAPTPGAATSSALDHPDGVAVDGSGNVYIADTNNNEVEKVTPGGTLSIIAGDGTGGLPTPGPATSSKLSFPGGVAVDGSGNV